MKKSKLFFNFFLALLLATIFSCKTETEYVEKTYVESVKFVAIASEDGESVNVSMSTATEGATIYYTTDESTPTTKSTLYTQAVNVTADTTFMALAVKDGMENSPISYAKVSITTKSITESGNPLEISLTATPNNAQNGKTNTSITVTATISSASTVKNVVYKKDGIINAATLLADENATKATVSESDNTKWSFTITASSEDEGNGTYTVAAIDNAGREETKQIKITHFDFTPPANVTAVSSSYKSETESSSITLKWTDPSDTDFDHILISYITNDGESDSEESDAVTVTKGTQTYILSGVDSTKEYYRFTIKTVDVLENKSSGRFIRSVGNDVLYDFHETVTSAGTTTIDNTEYKLVYFGDWPKTIKDDEISVDESVGSVTMGGNTYYLGSDNNYYAKCTENAYSSGYTYSDGTAVAKKSSNSTKYFKVEPITWRVLTEDYNSTGQALLLAEDILTNVYYYESYTNRTLDNTTIYVNNYKYSNIRAYLNGTKNQFETDGGTVTKYDVDWSDKGFLQIAFTSDAQSLIETTTVDNSAISTNPASNSSMWNSGTNTYACDDTEDKIFLLSEKEVTTTDYGFESYNSSGTGNARIRVTTDFAKANSAEQNITTSGYGGKWCLRSPSYDNNQIIWYIADSGAANGMAGCLQKFGIVPALCVSSESLPTSE